MKRQEGLEINQYCYQGCMKRWEGLQINQFCYQGLTHRIRVQVVGGGLNP